MKTLIAYCDQRILFRYNYTIKRKYIIFLLWIKDRFCLNKRNQLLQYQREKKTILGSMAEKDQKLHILAMICFNTESHFSKHWTKHFNLYNTISLIFCFTINGAKQLGVKDLLKAAEPVTAPEGARTRTSCIVWRALKPCGCCVTNSPYQIILLSYGTHKHVYSLRKSVLGPYTCKDFQ